MKYIKLFEKIEEEVRIGDYVSFNANSNQFEWEDEKYPGFKKYIGDAVGQVVDTSYVKRKKGDFVIVLKVYFDEIPYGIRSAFEPYKNDNRKKYRDMWGEQIFKYFKK
jgi:hypothetical protein